ncbi:hypothetical protein QWY85_01055 [Neolewinella lacunae]|uniref:HTH luxR-type domain-containing protein n=1 Tax=Neolewinella lacunae TaxID=1517758 RepID=A0A923T8Y4_9BACT|nr:hypothetical protein [Neolewinella lacunae]MBC6995006.1 hypothetical protein [Neolewinella lacunae]MDN3633223.1 hypothetical protein [Neolewinella lacunae]
MAVPRIRTFTSADYGGDSQNWDLTQAENGYLYVANSVGVLRYDGTRWMALPLPGEPTVRALAAHGQRLYAGGYGEFGYFENPHAAAPHYVSLASGLTGSDREEEIWNIELLPGGHVIFQSFGRFYHYDGERLRTVVPPGVMMFARVVRGELLIPVTGQGIFRWQPPAAFTPLPGLEALDRREVVGIVAHPQGLLLATPDGIWHYDSLGTLSPWSSTLNQALKGQQINRLLALEDGGYAVGTITSGLYLVDPDGSGFYILNEAAGLGNNTVLSLYESAGGNVWAGLDRGLDLIIRSASVSYRTGANSPPGVVYAAARYAGVSYLGTNQGLYRVDTVGDRHLHQLVPGTAGQVWELRNTPAGLLCGHNDGTFLLDERGLRRISDRSGGWQTLAVGGDERRLLQATYTGLQLLEWRGDSLLTHGLPGFAAPVRYIHWQSPDEVLALHGSRGAFRLRLSDASRSVSRIDTVQPNELVKASLADFGDTVILHGNEGNYLLEDTELVRLEHFRGVALEPGSFCLPGQGTTWFYATADRVRIYEGQQLRRELPLRLRIPYPRIVPWTHGAYLFLLDEGYAVVRPGQDTQPPAQLSITAAFRRQDGDWSDDFGTAETPSLRYRHNNLRFSYALPVFDRPIRFRSRLRGYSELWSEWSSRAEREFTNLPAGTYAFEVEGDWFGATAVFAFSVRRPWYRSWPAYLAYTFLLGLALTLLYRLHLRRLENQARQLEVKRRRQLQRERIMARNRELKADIRRKSEELANSTLNLAKKNEILLALKEEMAKSKRGGGPDQRKMLHLIDRNLNSEEDWAIFESHFNAVHEAFLKRLRKEFPTLSPGDLKLAAYLRMDLSSKEIAPLLHISTRGVENKRYRLRKKIGLEGDDNLNRFLLEF